MVLQKVADGYIEASNFQNTGPNMLKYGLKWPQGSTLAYPLCPQTKVFQNYGTGVQKFCLSVKNGGPKTVKRVY